jgi:hypothetical protein
MPIGEFEQGIWGGHPANSRLENAPFGPELVSEGLASQAEVDRAEIDRAEVDRVSADLIKLANDERTLFGFPLLAQLWAVR